MRGRRKARAEEATARTQAHRNGRLRFAAHFYSNFKRDGGVVLSAAMAYYALFALTPAVILMALAVSVMLGNAISADNAEAFINGVVSSQLGTLIIPVVRAYLASRQNVGTYSVIAAGFFLWAIIAGFLQLQRAFNMIWHVRLRDDLPFARKALLMAKRLVLVLLPAGLIIAVTITSSIVGWASNHLTGNVKSIVEALGSPIAVGIATWLATLALFVLLPYAKVRIVDAWRPALAVAVIWTCGTWLFGIYLAYAGTTSAAGAAGAIFVMLVWLNYSSRLLLLGCAACRELTVSRGAVLPADVAMTAEPDIAEA